MAVFERTHEFGLLRALGLKPGHVLALVALESTLLIGLGVLIGMAAGAGTVWGLSDGIDLSAFGKALEAFKTGDVLYLHINPVDYVIFPLAIWLLGVLVALWPAWRAAKIAPVEAMRHAT
jgi:ABC-type antimicrobial peptide transport system permease subunit